MCIRDRGITIFSKEISFMYRESQMTFLDTPGPVSYTHLTIRSSNQEKNIW